MKKILLLAVSAYSSILMAQPSTPAIRFVSSSPSGACANAPPLRYNYTNGSLWACQSGTWTQINIQGSGSFGPSGTLANGTLLVGTSASTYGWLATANGSVLNTNSSGVPSLTPTPVLGVASTTTGSIGLLNASNNFTFTLASATAMSASNTMTGPVAVPANGDLLGCTTTSTTCVITDAGVAYTNLVTAASNFTSGGLVYGAAANKTTANSADFTVSSHTITGGSSAILNLSAAPPTTGLLIPSAAGAAPTADGQLAVNTTTHALVTGSNGNTLVEAVAVSGAGNTATTCTNQVVTVISSIAAPTCTTLSSSYLPSAVVYNNAVNTAAAAMTLDMHSATTAAGFRVPVIASATAASTGVVVEDATAANYHIFAGGADAIVGAFASAPTTGHCVQATVSAGNVLLSDSGSTNCGGGGSTTLSAITAATASNTLANGNHGLQIWNWAPTSNQVSFTFGETTAATSGTLGNQYGVQVITLAGSTSVPLNVTSSLTGSQTLPTVHITPTWNTTGVVDAALLINPTNTASGTGSLLIDAQLGGTSQFSVDKAGNTKQLGSQSVGASAPAVTGTGIIGMGETTGQGCAAAADCLMANSSTHQLLLSNNNATAVPVVVGPASATSGHLATFSGTNGGVLQDGGAVPTGTVTSIATTGPIGGGTITATGTITCTTCVVATVNPSAGVGHFAGSTQTVTSSSVVSADMNITTTSCTAPKIVTAISAGGVGTCTAPDIPQGSHSAAYTTVLADDGTQILHPTADNNARTFTIDSNANVAYPIGATLVFVNQINTVTISITADTLQLAGTATTGSRTLAAGGIATAVKITTTLWFISGPGLT